MVKTGDDRYYCSFVAESGVDTLPTDVDEHDADIEVGLDSLIPKRGVR